MAGRKTPVKRPQRHGGALQSGSPGNRGGGRLPSLIREACRNSFNQRIPILEAIADGEPIEKMTVPVMDIVPHLKCKKCSGAVTLADASKSGYLTIEVKGSARAGDRRQAVDALGKYGLGDQFQLEMVHPMVVETITKWKELIATRPTWTREQLDSEFATIWQASVVEHFGDRGEGAFNSAGAAQ